MFRWLFSQKKSKKVGEIENLRTAIGINVAGDPDFHDLGPSPERIRARLDGSNLFSHELVTAAVDIAPIHIRNGGSAKGCIKKITERVPSATKAELKDLEICLLLEVSRANKLHNLRRMEEAGVTHCSLMACRDEADTEREKRLHDKRMTIRQARKLVESHSDEIPRAIFRAHIKF